MKRFVLLVCVLLAVTGLLLTPGCKSASDVNIVGEWVITISGSSAHDSTRTFIFSGTKETGNVEIKDFLSGGDYRVEGDQVRFNVTYGIASPHFAENFVGTINDDNSMDGDFTETFNEAIRDHGTFTGAR